MTEPHTAKAGDWFDARQRGERLPEHEIYCGLCGERMGENEASEEVRAVAGFDICATCLEDELNASTIEPRAEMGVVGKCGGGE